MYYSLYSSKRNGIEGEQPIIDKYAPLYHVRADAPPLLLITGDRELELLGRYEENTYMYRMMKVAGHNETELWNWMAMIMEWFIPLYLYS